MTTDHAWLFEIDTVAQFFVILRLHRRLPKGPKTQTLHCLLLTADD